MNNAPSCSSAESSTFTHNEVSRSVSMEFDWKRPPVGAATRPIKGIGYSHFDTAPWQDKSAFDHCRESFAVFRGAHTGIVKTVADLRDFLEFCDLHRTVEPSVRIPRRDPALTLAKRSFLRAYVRSQWSLDAQAMSYSELAHWLTTVGYGTRKTDVENANRPTARLLVNVVPPTPAVIELVAKAREIFPPFDSSKLLQRGATNMTLNPAPQHYRSHLTEIQTFVARHDPDSLDRQTYEFIQSRTRTVNE
jgi:hypothetical protein